MVKKFAIQWIVLSDLRTTGPRKRTCMDEKTAATILSALTGLKATCNDTYCCIMILFCEWKTIQSLILGKDKNDTSDIKIGPLHI